MLLLYSYSVTFGFERNKPNIVLILIDDMEWKDVGYVGSTYYETPNIDKFASERIRFTNVYSAAPVCTPSQGAIFSGKNPGRTQLTTVFAGKAGSDDRLYDESKYRNGHDQYFEARHRHALPDEEVILAQVFRFRTGPKNTKATAFIKKIGQGDAYMDDYGLVPGDNFNNH